MRRRLLGGMVALLLLAGVLLALGNDLALLAWRQGRERLGAGDHQGALALLERANHRLPGACPIAFDTGVAYYRLGRLAEAADRFAAAARATEPHLRSAALYNLGNCLVRQGQRGAAGDRQGSLRLYQRAVSAYQRCLALLPEGADARHNLAVARLLVSEQTGSGGAGRGAAGRGTGASGAPRKEESAVRGSTEGGAAGRAEASGAARETERLAGGAGAGREERSQGVAQAGKGANELSREQAERLLNEARRGEAVSGALQVKGAPGRQARPEKDW